MQLHAAARLGDRADCHTPTRKVTRESAGPTSLQSHERPSKTLEREEVAWPRLAQHSSAGSDMFQGCSKIFLDLVRNREQIPSCLGVLAIWKEFNGTNKIQRTSVEKTHRNAKQQGSKPFQHDPNSSCQQKRQWWFFWLKPYTSPNNAMECRRSSCPSRYVQRLAREHGSHSVLRLSGVSSSGLGNGMGRAPRIPPMQRLQRKCCASTMLLELDFTLCKHAHLKE